MRLWIPRRIVPNVNVDMSIVEQLEKRPVGAHQLALCAHVSECQGDIAKANQLMNEAKEWYFDDDSKSDVHGSLRHVHSMSYLFALDWIVWDDTEQFERAFREVH